VWSGVLKIVCEGERRALAHGIPKIPRDTEYRKVQGASIYVCWSKAVTWCREEGAVHSPVE